ncbi:hypothetical protein, partial [Streptomyces sp. SDr-06]|uniref:hypothetical protein n=1 Tax=Streptomyces sp. SDr-06 TaxID=2267702 RepID=UPI001CB93A20
ELQDPTPIGQGRMTHRVIGVGDRGTRNWGLIGIGRLADRPEDAAAPGGSGGHDTAMNNWNRMGATIRTAEATDAWETTTGQFQLDGVEHGGHSRPTAPCSSSGLSTWSREGKELRHIPGSVTLREVRSRRTDRRCTTRLSSSTPLRGGRVPKLAGSIRSVCGFWV